MTLFAECGYRGTSVAAVGRAAGMASAAVHWYFPTKDDLFAAALTSIFSTARERIEEDPAVAGDPRDELVALLTELQPYRALHREAYERMEESESIRVAYEQVQDWLEERLFAAISNRLPPGADVELIAEAAHVLFEGILISMRRVDRPTGDLIDLLTDSLVAAAIAKSSR
ncbi:TetR/AcrR family transcriptional regulator [Rhodococcus sp. MSC1_016]|uniref:TetR/AcrR family transcriptional regulator n=1 Tax=Rhodococcus sp. MSC1_016 TaxID=2909266 RepID=UPI0027DFC7BD|nr:TetR/AcrR family transcriptional regulator [Rhodococcus sp. MSC1_016]